MPALDLYQSYKFVEIVEYWWVTVVYLEPVVRSGYYSTEDVPTDFVNVSLSSRCNPAQQMFSSCVGEVNDRQDQCDNVFASIACPGKQ